MALLIPGCPERIKRLWDEYARDNRPKSQRQWAKEHGFDPSRFNSWLHGGQPDYEGLMALGRVFGVPWQWILLGEEGLQAMRDWDAARKRGSPAGEPRATPVPGRPGASPSSKGGRSRKAADG